MPTDLVVAKLDTARQALIEAKTIQETKTVLDVAVSAKVYARRHDLGKEAVLYATAIEVEALAQLGRMLKETQRNTGAKGEGPIAVPKEYRNQAPTLADLGLNKKTSKLAQDVAALPAEQIEKVKTGVATLVSVQRELKEAKRETRRDGNRAKVNATKPIEEIGAKFSTITIDPPWDWGDEADNDQLGRARPTYQTMTLDKLLNLPIEKLSDVDCHLYLWITNRSLPKGFALLEKWGFRYITCITWVKPSFGMGNYFRGQTEHILFGVRGSQMLKRKDAPTVLVAKRGPNGHSSKPIEFYDLVESCSPGPYLEMFARSNRKDWTSWGAEV